MRQAPGAIKAKGHPSRALRRRVDATRWWFLRHGEVESPWVGKLIGRTDVGLSPLGRHQAEAVKAYLEDAAIDAVLASPRKRARDTVAPTAAHHGKIVEIRKGLAEMDFGDWDGLGWDEVVANDTDLALSWEQDPVNVAPPSGESVPLFQERIDAELERIRSEFKGRTILMGGHAGTNRAILSNVLKRPYLECFQFAQDYGCLNAVAWTKEGFSQVALLNFVAGPRAEHQGE